MERWNMGLIINLIRKYRENKQIQKSDPEQEIEDHIQSERMKNKIDTIWRYEKHEFLYGRGNDE